MIDDFAVHYLPMVAGHASSSMGHDEVVGFSSESDASDGRAEAGKQQVGLRCLSRSSRVRLQLAGITTFDWLGRRG
jgi:hypothetical protein